MRGQSDTERNNIARSPVPEHAVLQGGMAPPRGIEPLFSG